MEVAPPEDPTSATSVLCGDPTKEYKLEAPTVAVDYYSIYLDSGQLLKVDVDAETLEPIGSSFDYVLMLFDFEGNPLAEGDDEQGTDPVLQFNALEDGTYIVAVSTYNASVPDPYKITFECTNQGPVSTLEIGDLLASTASPGLIEGSLLSIDQETESSEFRFPLGKFGPVADIEFRDDGVLFGATGGESGSIITIDVNSGVETLVGTLQSGAVVALEFGGDPVSLYGIYLVADDEPSQLGTINQENGEFTVVAPTGYTKYGRVDGLAFDSRTGTMYGVGPGLKGIELMTIDLATGVATEVGPTGVTSQIFALEFGPDGSLYGATDEGTLVTINTATGEASEAFIIGEAATETATQAFSTSSAKVSGLAFVPGWESPPKSTTITSLDNNPFMGRLIDKFKFEGVKGEWVTITVKNLNQETEDALPSEDEQTTPKMIKSKWKWRKNNLLAAHHLRGRAFLSLRDAMSDLDFRVREKGQMTLTIGEVELPATGLYYIILMQPVPRSLRVDYSLTMTSSADAVTTLKATRLIERRKWYSGAKNNVTADSTEQPGAASTLQSTSLTSTGESTPITPAADGDSEDGQTAGNTTTVDDPDDEDGR
jgi:hypothetical protein